MGTTAAENVAKLAGSEPQRGPLDVLQQRSHALSWQAVAPVSVCFAVAACVLFYQLGAHPLFNPDEALYAEPAREMLETREYITTLLNYIVRLTKPPLVIWAMMASYSVFGVSEFAARFVCAASGAVLIAMTQMFLTRYAGVRAGVIAAASLLCAPLFVGTSREAITDIPLSLLMAGSIMLFFRAYAERSRASLYGAYILVAFAVMTKGPVGLVLPLAVLFLFHCANGSLRSALSVLKPRVGLLLVAAVALPWYIAEIIITRGAYFHEFIVRENFQRFTSVVDSHKGAWWYHIAAMMGGFFPFCVFLPQAIVATVKSSVPECASEQTRRSWPHAALEAVRRAQSHIAGLDIRDKLNLYSLVWAATILIFFSASTSKLLPYTLPAFPAIAILVGIYIDRCLAEGRRLSLLIPCSVVAIIYGAALMAAPFIVAKLRGAPEGALDLARQDATAALIGGLAAVVAFLVRRQLVAISLFAMTNILIVVLALHNVVPLISQKWEGAIPIYSAYAATSSDPIFIFGVRKPSVPFYARRQVFQAWTWPVLMMELNRRPRAYVITRARNKDQISMLPGCKVLHEMGDSILVLWINPSKVGAVKDIDPQLLRIQL